MKPSHILAPSMGGLTWLTTSRVQHVQAAYDISCAGYLRCWLPGMLQSNHSPRRHRGCFNIQTHLHIPMLIADIRAKKTQQDQSQRIPNYALTLVMHVYGRAWKGGSQGRGSICMYTHMCAYDIRVNIYIFKYKYIYLSIYLSIYLVYACVAHIDRIFFRSVNTSTIQGLRCSKYCCMSDLP